MAKENQDKKARRDKALQALQDTWLEENPLRRWIARFPQRRKVADVCRLTGRSHQQVYYYMTGHTYPKADVMRQLAELMKVSYDQLEVRWRKWWVQKPEEEWPKKEA